MPYPVRLLLPLLLLAPSTAMAGPTDGRYGLGWRVIRVESRGDQVVVRPLWWGGNQALTPRSPAVFEMANRREAVFIFSEPGPRGFAALRIEGHPDLQGDYRRLDATSSPLEAVLAGDPVAVGGLGLPEAEAFQLVNRLARSIPSRLPAMYPAIRRLAETAEPAQPWLRLAGDSAAALGRRGEAESYYRRALAADAGNPEAAAGLRQLGKLPSPADPGLPFPLESVYASPTRQELAEVARDWASRDLVPRDIHPELTAEVRIGAVPFAATVLSYRVHDQLNHGAILVPVGAKGPLPVLVDLKGVSVAFDPLTIPGGLVSPHAMGADLGRFVIVAPAVRGEALVMGDRRFQNEGDPADSWDGATDDAISFLTAALGACREADPRRIVALGKSRGGTTAMLLGARDPRVKAVAAWSGPAGWIGQMRQLGWSQLEQVREGLFTRAGLTGPGGQAIRTFLSAALEGREDLARVRHRLIASSPVYFVERFPPSQLHWGENDPVVEPSNGKALATAAAHVPRLLRRLTFIYEADGGHDLDPLIAVPNTRAFLLSHAGLRP